MTNRQLGNTVNRQGMSTLCKVVKKVCFYYVLSEICGHVCINGQVHVFKYA